MDTGLPASMPTGLSASLFSRTGNDLPDRSVRPTGLRGHGLGDVIRIRECYSEADVRISPSKVPRPLLQRYINFSLVILRVPPPSPSPPRPPLPPSLPISENTSTPPLYLYSNHSGLVLVHFAHPDCTSLSTLISAPFIFAPRGWKK